MKRFFKFFACVALVGSFFMNGLYASSSTAYLYADDNFVNTSSVPTLGSSNADRIVFLPEIGY